MTCSAPYSEDTLPMMTCRNQYKHTNSQQVYPALPSNLATSTLRRAPREAFRLTHIVLPGSRPISSASRGLASPAACTTLDRQPLCNHEKWFNDHPLRILLCRCLLRKWAAKLRFDRALRHGHKPKTLASVHLHRRQPSLVRLGRSTQHRRPGLHVEWH